MPCSVIASWRLIHRFLNIQVWSLPYSLRSVSGECEQVSGGTSPLHSSGLWRRSTLGLWVILSREMPLIEFCLHRPSLDSQEERCGVIIGDPSIHLGLSLRGLLEEIPRFRSRCYAISLYVGSLLIYGGGGVSVLSYLYMEGGSQVWRSSLLGPLSLLEEEAQFFYGDVEVCFMMGGDSYLHGNIHSLPVSPSGTILIQIQT